ncbi:hypothetical protein Ddc_12301 [Ditylenchus destructor]|nr:hypothetical protein Ddc_12301 [Ditylenchus destructor]
MTYPSFPPYDLPKVENLNIARHIAACYAMPELFFVGIPSARYSLFPDVLDPTTLSNGSCDSPKVENRRQQTEGVRAPSPKAKVQQHI